MCHLRMSQVTNLELNIAGHQIDARTSIACALGMRAGLGDQGTAKVLGLLLLMPRVRRHLCKW